MISHSNGAGECLAEGPRQTLQTMLHEAVHALAPVRGVKDTSRGGKYHNKREFVVLAGELGLAWPQGQRPHPVIGQDFQPQDTVSGHQQQGGELPGMP
jgi:hypothetical protein